MTTLTTVVPTIFPSPLPTHDNGRPNDFPFAIVDAADLRRERNRKRMARIRSKSKEVRDAAERLMEHVATTVAADIRRERNRKRMARIRSKSKEVRDARYRP
jgi:hypothetical protein